MRFSAILAFLSCVALLSGCANPGSLVAGQSTSADVRARMGTPTDTRKDRNGDELLEYATGPEGFETYLVRIGADGKVKDVTRLVTEEQLAKVAPGSMKQGEVRELLGRPSFEHVYMAGLTWTWRFKRYGVMPGYLVVTFNPDGTVKDKIAIIDPNGESRDE
jgi:SmpA / OmlA family